LENGPAGLEKNGEEEKNQTCNMDYDTSYIEKLKSLSER
jgi:hypothetical protein